MVMIVSEKGNILSAPSLTDQSSLRRIVSKVHANPNGGREGTIGGSVRGQEWREAEGRGERRYVLTEWTIDLLLLTCL